MNLLRTLLLTSAFCAVCALPTSAQQTPDMKIFWDPPSGWTDGYVVYLQEGNSPMREIGRTTDTQYLVPGSFIPLNRSYAFRVTTLRGGEESIPSEPLFWSPSRVAAVGLGKSPVQSGLFEVMHADKNRSYGTNKQWGKIHWESYLNADGSTEGILMCNVENDARPETIVVFNEWGGDENKFTALIFTQDSNDNYLPSKWVTILKWKPLKGSTRGRFRLACGQGDEDGYQEMFGGFGSGSDGRMVYIDDVTTRFRVTHIEGAWWKEYREQNGEIFPALCNLDGSGVGRPVFGLGKGGQGYFGVLRSKNEKFVFSSWHTTSDPQYNAHGEVVIPACGNLDSDRMDELALGTIGYTVGNKRYGGRVEIRDDLSTGLKSMRWVTFGIPNFNLFGSGRVYPAIGDVTGDGHPELLIGMDEYPSSADGGWVQVLGGFKVNNAHLQWLRVHWETQNGISGLAAPAAIR